MLKNDFLFAKIGADTAKNEPRKAAALREDLADAPQRLAEMVAAAPGAREIAPGVWACEE